MKNGLQHFDAWASTFGETITAVELTPEGTGYRAKTRFAKFYNLPELMAMFKEVADIKTADMLNLPVPEAKYHNIAVKPSEMQKEMVASLAERAEQVRGGGVDSSVDNMLKITNDGRKLALDQRMLNDMLPDFEGSKINACVDNIYRIWEKNTDKKSAQLVFCDLSTPKNDGTFSVYNDIRKKLIERGIPESEVKFIHEADTDMKKKELFQKTRKGEVRVLLGSTQKMGAGTNVQDKLIALHDVDCPWRPSDLEQRSGRIVRQGNENPQVDIYRYVTEQTFDAYDTILRADKVTAEMIPALCDYVIFSENGEKIGGDLSEQYEQIAWNVAKYGNASGKYFYKVIVRENEYVVLQYRLTPQYHSAFLREHFIGPQNVMIIMSVIGAVAIIIIPSIRFGKRIKKQMQPVLDAIGQIKDQNLEYETSCSGIKEFDDCLSAIDDMRDALRESLEKQWKTEQEKKQQMSALAHDIKTPLTIVRGNAELLSETELTTEQKKNITYVLNGTTQIQSYVKQLIDVTKSWNCSDVTYTTVRLEDFFADIKEQALGLVEIYHQKIDWKAEQSDKKVTIAYDPMFRAVMNVIQNAVEHSKENGIIYIDAKEQDDRLTFIVEDSGSGFTKEALLHGTEQFFMDDTSRNGEAHYGMGLFFAKTVAEKYGGGIKLSNSENTGGARVEIFFLSSQETS